MLHKVFWFFLVILVLAGCSDNRRVDHGTPSTSSVSVTSASDLPASSQPPSEHENPPAKSTASSMTQSSSSDGHTDQSQYVWKRDVYPESDLFKGCAFAEKSASSIRDTGSELTELFYLRSVIKEKFHWGNELTDLDPNGYLKKPANFEQHLTNMRGRKGYYAGFLRTSMSFSDDLISDKYLSVLSDEELEMQKRISNSASFGINWSIDQAKERKMLFVRYTEGVTGSQFDKLENIERGDRLISVNDTDVETLLSSGDFETLYKLLYPKKLGAIGKFVFESRTSKTTKTVNLTSFDVINFMINEKYYAYVDGNEKLGYLIVPRLDTELTYRGRHPEAELNVVFDDLKNLFKVKDLIVDLRYTSFGSLDVASQLATLIAGNYTDDRVFARHKASSGDVSSKSNKETPFIFHCLNYYFPTCAYPDNNADFVFIKRIHRFRHMLHLKRVFVIVSKETCGVAEAFINALLGIDFEVILIGGNTCGKPYFGSYVGKCGIKYNIPEFQVLNEKNFGGYEKGFRPSNAKHLPGIPVKGCFAEENDFSHPWRSPSDPYIAAALQYRKDGTCPPIPKDVKGRDD